MGGFQEEVTVRENIHEGAGGTVWLPVGVLVLGVLVLCYVLLVQAVLPMLRSRVNQVLLTFALLSLVTLPPVFLLGVSGLILGRSHKQDLPSAA